MAIGAAGPGARGGWSDTLTTRNLMDDKRYQPSLPEQLLLGAAKAHRTVVYSHYEYRNYNRSNQLGSTGCVIVQR